MSLLEKFLSAKRKHEVRKSDLVFSFVLLAASSLIIVLFLAFFVFLIRQSLPVWKTYGLHFVFSSEWDPNTNEFGALPFISGTLFTSLFALLISVPVAVGAALFLTELAPKWIRVSFGFLIEMLAAIPSVVYGLWGIFVLVPIVREQIQPFFQYTLGYFSFFTGPPLGIGVFSASLILAIMILPTIAGISREIFLTVPIVNREAALSLGATRWEAIRLGVLQAALPGVVSAIIMGLGRALGETMAVTMLIGNRPEVVQSLFKPGATMASVIANEYPEASSDMHLAAMAAIGLVLFFVSLLVNTLAKIIVNRSKARLVRAE